MHNLLSPYLSWLMIFFVFPTLLLWAIFHKLLWRYKRVYISSVMASVTVIVIMDSLAIKWQAWSWSSTRCSLPQIFNLPAEEILGAVLAAVYLSTLTLIMREVFLHHLKHRAN